MELSTLNSNNISAGPTKNNLLHMSNNYCINNNGTDKRTHENENSDIRELLNELLSSIATATIAPLPPQQSQPQQQTQQHSSPRQTDGKQSKRETSDGTTAAQNNDTQTLDQIEESETPDRLQPSIEEIEDCGKDIVTLKNLELTPPPEERIKRKRNSELEESSDSVDRGRQSTGTDDLEESSCSSRSKRQRTQTKLFQAGAIKEQESARGIRAARSSTPMKQNNPRTKPQQTNSTNKSAQNDSIDVIFYEKNDYLAIRNEENTFYLCQLAENVRVKRPLIKVKWLDTNDDGQTYFLTSHYDKVPQKSIIMPVILDKLKSDKKGGQIFTLDEHVKLNIMERLKRSLNVPMESNPED